MNYALPIALVMAMFCSTTFCRTTFADEGQISHSLLSDMGLSCMTVISDTDAMQVRGHGFAIAGSLSASALPCTFNVSSALAVGSHGANAVSGAASSAHIHISAGGPLGLPLFHLDKNITVGSIGYAHASTW